MDLEVACEAALFLEGEAADVADVGAVVGVDSELVAGDVVLLAERLAARGAEEGLLLLDDAGGRRQGGEG